MYEKSEIVRYKYTNKPVVVATVDVSDGKEIRDWDVAEFLESEGIKFDYLAYDESKFRYYAMLRKKGFERCE